MKEVHVPNVASMTLYAAESELKSLGLNSGRLFILKMQTIKKAMFLKHPQRLEHALKWIQT